MCDMFSLADPPAVDPGNRIILRTGTAEPSYSARTRSVRRVSFPLAAIGSAPPCTEGLGVGVLVCISR